MRSINWIAMDVGCTFCAGGWKTTRGEERGAWQVPTAIPPIREELEKVPRPRVLVIEEGSLADWLYRELSPFVDQMVVCDPYRNALIAKDGDKDDPIDWRKLADLARGGYLRAVHHNGTLERSVLKQHVLLYHQRVTHQQAEAMRVVWWCRQFGVFIKKKDLLNPATRSELAKRLPDVELLRKNLRLLLKGFDVADDQVKRLRRRLARLARGNEQIRRFMELPGVKVVRATTFYAIVDTPFRFKSKQALWKYLGIGLERHHSGTGPTRLRVPLRCNRVLKGMILGAAKSASRTGKNIFAEQHERWLTDGCSARVARRNLARSLSAVMWGMWKSGREFDARLVTANCCGKQLAEAGPRR
jgi:transposase